MIKSLRHSHLGLLLAVFLAISASSLLPAQESTGQRDIVSGTINKIGHTRDGILVLAVRIHAKKSDSLLLVGNPTTLNPAKPELVKPFSLQGSYLVDVYTENKIPALSTLPPKPFYGPMSIVTRVSNEGWVQLGVAFPKPPPPPPDKDGKPQDYKFMLHVAVIPEPVLVTYSDKE